jgi:hypothetical protein
MSRFPYQFFEEYVVRTPLLSCRDFLEKINENTLSDKELKEICSDTVFQEAIYLASPYLYEELVQWLMSEERNSSHPNEKLKNTILKYHSRMSTRCTPFGLFSGVGLGKFRDEISILAANNSDTSTPLSVTRDTKLDMHFLVSLAKHFDANPFIRSKIQHFPNNSIYKIRDKIRYVEYENVNGKRDYIISTAPLSNELENILQFSKHGKTIQEIAEILINNEIGEEDAKEFIDELIDNQVLVSELEPNVSGNDFLDKLISVLHRIGFNEEEEKLRKIKDKLNNLDSNLGNPVSHYTEIEELIKSFQTDYEKKYLFQTDLYFDQAKELSTSWKKELKKGMSFLNKMTLLNKDTHLEKFKKAFYDRFEDQEIPLSFVLDAEVGIGYRQDVNSKGVHPYLEDLVIPVSQSKKDLFIQLSPVHKIINEKLQEALLENQFIVELTDDDFKDFDENWNDLPDTISLMTTIVSENQKEKMVLESGGGSSAANLLGRFCSEKSELQNFTKLIAKKEVELNPNKILAEIIHLPEARIGNVIRRPTLRNYEIPYLAQSVLPEEKQISVDDLYISLKNDKIILCSKKLNKEIKPYLTNAHNYYGNSLPMYHFLADLHSDNRRTGIYFNWGGLHHIYKFFPRLEYKNMILSKAAWKITEKDIEPLKLSINNKEEFLSDLNSWRIKRKIPGWIQWVQSDNTLTMNLENYDFAKLFIQIILKEKSIMIEEFLYNENDDFMRQFIFSMHRSN